MRLMNEIVDPTECFVAPYIEQVKQPGDGYVNPELFEVVPFDGRGEDVDALNSRENVNSVFVDTAVDRMSRFLLGAPVRKAFFVPLLNSRIFMEDATVRHLMDGIKDLDDESIINAVKLSAFDGSRVGDFTFFKPGEEIDPDGATIENVKTMVERSFRFFKLDDPSMPEGFTLARECLVTTNTGFGEIMIPNTLWDLKTSGESPTEKDTLRLLVYWLMGLYSCRSWLFEDVEYLGIYNPRLNEAYRISVDDIPDDAIAAVEKCLW